MTSRNPKTRFEPPQPKAMLRLRIVSFLKLCVSRIFVSGTFRFRLVVSKLLVSELSERFGSELFVSARFVSELFVSELCVSELCVSDLFFSELCV